MADADTRKSRAGNDLKIGAPVRVSQLNTLPRIFAEKARVYRECRHREGRYPTAMVGARLTGMLNELSSQLLLQQEVAQLAQAVADLRVLVMARESKEGAVYVPGAESGIKSIAETASGAERTSRARIEQVDSASDDD